MKRTFIAFLLVPAILLGACAPGSPAATATVAGTPTPTPFLPGGVIPEPAAQPTQENPLDLDIVFGQFPPPSEPSDIEIPPPVAMLPQPEGQVNILILGSDQRPNEGGFRTDVIELLTINPADNSVSMTSFPRDLYVYHPGWHVSRINAGMQRGGMAMMADTFAYNFGVRPDYYVLVNFGGFTQLVDALGGIDVQVARRLTDEREGPGDFSVPAGLVHMDGETALWYARSRGTSNDYDRGRRHQELITALFFRLFSLNALTRAPELYTQYRRLVSSDIELSDVLPLLPLAGVIANNQTIHRYSIGPDDVTSFRNSNGSSVLIPNQERVRRILLQALSSPESGAAGGP